jgi:PAS domain S-box-containing protein
MDKTIRVLIAEDSEDDAQLILRELQRGGYTPAFERVDTPDGMSAALARQSWDLVISDYAMPSFSGIEALKLLRAQGGEVPFLLVSGTIAEERAVESLKAGADDFLVKGNWARLLPAVERALREADGRRARRRVEQELRESENLRRTIFESEPECVKLVAAAGTVVHMNRAGLAMVEADVPEQVIGRPVFPLIADAYRAEYRRRLDNVFRGASEIFEFEIVGLKGTRRWMESHAVPLRNDAGQIFAMLSITRDMTNRKLAEETLRRRADEFAALYDTARSLAENLNLSALLPAIVERATDLLSMPHGTIYLYDVARGDLEMVSARNEKSSLGVRMPLGEGPIGRAARTRETIIDNDYEHSDLRARVVRDPPFIAVASVPMIYGGELIGVLSIAQTARDGHRFTPGDARILELFAAQAASAVHNARLFEETHRRLQHLQALREIDLTIASSMDLSMTLEVLIDQVISQLGVDAADVLILTPSSQTLEYAVGRGFYGEALKHTYLRLGDGLAGRAALERTVIEIHNLDAALVGPLRTTLLEREHFVDYHAVPLIAKGQVKGVLEVFHRKSRQQDPEWLEFLEALGSQAAIAIDNATLFEGLQHSNLELRLAYDTTLEGWSRALDLRDKVTEGHTQRVAEMTVRLASAMGLAEDELVHIRRGALLHDMGKMGVPDQILLKAGPLTAEEWEIMRRHPQYAYDMLSRITFLGPAIEIPYAHHEKWDGTGYPLGLKGDKIPLSARIFAVVDVWDALRSDRPYRRAWPASQVRAHISSLNGAHFDPHVIEVFMRLEPRELEA